MMVRLALRREEGKVLQMSEMALFEERPVRRVFHNEEWWFVLTDIVSALTDSPAPSDYLKKLRRRDPSLAEAFKGGGQIVPPLRFPLSNGGRSAKAPVLERPWSSPADPVHPLPQGGALSSFGSPRWDTNGCGRSPIRLWRWSGPGRLGASWAAAKSGFTQRMTGQETRNKLTDYWAAHEVKQGQEFAILTNIIHQEWSGVSVKDHKDLKGLKSQNLRDHMSEAELIFTALAELSTRQIAETARRWACPPTRRPQRPVAGLPIAPGSNLKARPVERW